MSLLKLYRGESAPTSAPSSDERTPDILSYESHFQRWRDYRNGPVWRARTLRNNDRCPKCARPQVEPLELADAVRNRNNMPIPGTATLVGFHCLTCHWEWPA